MVTLDVKSQGASGDGATDDTEAFNKALRAAKGGKLIVPPGHYMIDATKGVRPLSNTMIELDDNAVLEVIPNAEKSYKLMRLRNCNNVTIRGGTLKGDRKRHRGTAGEWGIGIHVGSGCKDIFLYNIHSREMWGDGFYIGGPIPPKRVTMRNCVSDFNRRQGLSIVSGSEITVINSRFSNTRGTRPQSGIDIEPNRNGPAVHNVLIERNHFINNGAVAIQIIDKWAPVGAVTIRKNRYVGQRPLKIRHTASNYRRSMISKLFCIFQNYRLEITDCQLP